MLLFYIFQGHIRFKNAGGAQKAIDAVKDANDGKIIIKDVESTVKVLEGNLFLFHFEKRRGFEIFSTGEMLPHQLIMFEISFSSQMVLEPLRIARFPPFLRILYAVNKSIGNGDCEMCVIFEMF